MTSLSPYVNSPRLTTAHRQPRQPDTNLVQLDRRITALEDLGDARGRRLEVFRLRRRYQHLDRDKEQRPSQWYQDAANLTLAIDREEARRAG